MNVSRALAGVLSPEGRRAALSVLIFHRVLERPDPLFPEEPDVKRFDEILSWLGSAFNVMPLASAVERLGSDTLPSRAVAITFDDGYRDNVEVALPILARHRLHATFFIASGYLDGGRMWNDTVIEAVRRHTGDMLDLSAVGLGCLPTSTPAERRNAIDRALAGLKYRSPDLRAASVLRVADAVAEPLPDDLMMSSKQVRLLRASGMDVGGHTRHHPILASTKLDEARAEIEGGKSDLEGILGERITLFAYPNGKPERDYRSTHVTMVREAGFEAAVSTSTGAARRTSDRFQLPRFTPWDRSQLKFGLRLVNNLRTRGAVAP